MPQEALITKLKRRPMLSLAFMILSGFCLLIMTGIFAPAAISLLKAIDEHGLSGMGWPHFLVMAWAALYGFLGFGFYLAFKVLEKVVVDEILTALPKLKKEKV